MATNGQEGHITPTGCFKCGRPGHWSRDCPANPASGPGAVGASSTVQGGLAREAQRGATVEDNRFVGKGSLKRKGSKGSAAEEATAKAPRKRPQLNADLLLSDNGLGYLLEKMPQMVRIRGEGHEVQNLRALLEGYLHWHSLLHPYLGFNDFVAKVEKLGATKRVRMCVRELRDKVTSGVVHDANHDADNENISSEVARPSVEGVTTGNGGTECDEWLGADSSDLHDNDANMDPAMPVNEDEFEDFFRQGTIQPNELLGRGGGQPNGESTGAPSPARKLPSLLEEELPPAARTPVAVDETLAARMEANRLKAVERAKARRAMNASS